MSTLLHAEEGHPPALRGVSTGDAQLLEYMVGGDRAAFERLYDRHVRSVHAYALTHLEHREDAEEITQDVFVALREKRATIAIHGVSVVPWLLVIYKNKIANRRRALEVRSRRSGGAVIDEFTASGTPGPEQTVQDRQLQATLEAAIDSLPDIDRAIFDACLVDGLSYIDAANQIGVSSGTIRNRLARLRIRLRGELHTLKGTP